MNNQLNRQDAYIAELNEIISKSGPLRAFTQEENIYMAGQQLGGMYNFNLEQTKRDVEAALELKSIHVNKNNK